MIDTPHTKALKAAVQVHLDAPCGNPEEETDFDIDVAKACNAYLTTLLDDPAMVEEVAREICRQVCWDDPEPEKLWQHEVDKASAAIAAIKRRTGA